MEDQPDHVAVGTEVISECRAWRRGWRACFRMRTKAKSDNELVFYLHAPPCTSTTKASSGFTLPSSFQIAIANREKHVKYSKLDIAKSAQLRSEDPTAPSICLPSHTQRKRFVDSERRNLMPWQFSPVSNEVENSTLRRSNATHTRPENPQKIATKPGRKPVVRNTKSASLCTC